MSAKHFDILFRTADAQVQNLAFFCCVWPGVELYYLYQMPALCPNVDCGVDG